MVGPAVGACAADFLLIPNGANVAPTNIADRFCGGALNALAGGASTTVCCKKRLYDIFEFV